MTDEKGNTTLSSSNITSDHNIKTDPNRNLLEQFLDHMHTPGSKFGNFYGNTVSVCTPNRKAPLIRLCISDCKVTSLRFEIPHRIDMASKYSEEINNAVDTRDELPFAVYRYVRTINNKTIDISCGCHHFYHATIIDGGKYGKFMSYSINDNKNNRSCLPMDEFIEWLEEIQDDYKK